MKESTAHIREFIRHLLSAVANAALYDMQHPQVIRLSAQAFAHLEKSLFERHDFSLAIIENEMVIDGQPQEFSLFLNRFIEILATKGISHIRLIQGISHNEINQLISTLATRNKLSGQDVSSSEHIRIGWVDIKDEQERAAATIGQGEHVSTLPCSVADIPAAELARFREIYDAIQQHHKLKIHGIIETVAAFADVYRQNDKGLMLAAASIQGAEKLGFTHATNVSIMNIAQASALGIEGQTLIDIGVAGMLHDIGKLFLPEELLHKSDTFTPAELHIIKSHPVKGARYLLETAGVPRMAVISAYEHHIRYDHSGYPVIPDGWQQNLCSHITAISDTYDALRSKRTYRDALSLKQIASIMIDMMGIELHPVLTKNFLNMLARHIRQQ